MKKLYSFLLVISISITCCACGKSQESVTESATDCTTDEEQQIVISSIQIEPKSKTMYAQLVIPKSDASNGNNYSIGGLDAMDIKTTDTSEGLVIQLYGFYTDDEAWNDPKVYKGFQSPDHSIEPLENVTVDNSVTQIGGAEYQAAVDNGTTSVPVKLTPYTVSICPADDWREEKNFYHVIATDINGNRYYMCSLPITDDRKPSEKKENPLSDTTDLNALGNGFSSAVETEHYGIRYAFNEEIEVTNIEKIEINTFLSSSQ